MANPISERRHTTDEKPESRRSSAQWEAVEDPNKPAKKSVASKSPAKRLSTTNEPSAKVIAGSVPEKAQDYASKSGLLVVTGALGGCLGTALGIGGGTIMVPLLTMLCHFSLAKATAVSVSSIVVASGLGVLTESIGPVVSNGQFGGNILWLMVFPLAAGAFMGIRLGMVIRRMAPERWLTWAFGLVLMVSALKLAGLITIGGEGFNGYFDEVWESNGYNGDGWSFLIAKGAITIMLGLIGGMSVPLFGLGGGVVYVPALAILFREFDTTQVARGTSMATVFLNSSFATWIIWRQGMLPVAALKRVLPGTVVGAIAGVFIANLVDSTALAVAISIFIGFAAIQMVVRAEAKQRRAA